MSRIVLKISGEALKDKDENVSYGKLKMLLNLVNILKDNHEIAIVVGGGNFFRGRSHQDMDAVTADTIGMLGTIMNALYIKDYLTKNNLECIISTPFKFPNLIEEYQDEELQKLSAEKKIIIFGGGIGKSGYSTDSGTILAATKLHSDLIIKLSNVDGVYNDDPHINKKALKYDYLTYEEVIKKDLKVMDAYAIKKCQELNIKILVMNFEDYLKVTDYFKGQKVGTLIGGN